MRVGGISIAQGFQYGQCAAEVARLVEQVGEMRLELCRALVRGEEFDSALELIRREIEMAFLFEGEGEQLRCTTIIRMPGSDLLEESNRAGAVVEFRSQRRRTKEFALRFESADQGILIAGPLEAASGVRPFLEICVGARGLAPGFGGVIHLRRAKEVAGILEEPRGTIEIRDRAAQLGGFPNSAGVFELFGRALCLTLFLM